MLPAKEELQSIYQLLELTNHRNKNQHRLAKWWKSFSELRRQVFKLIGELETLETAEKFSASGAAFKSRKEMQKPVEGDAGETKYVRAAREKVEERVQFLQERCMERWYLAFLNLVADNQYAVLGLVLIGTLARFRTVIRILGAERDESDREGSVDLKSEIRGDEMAGVDLGEVIRRDEKYEKEEIINEGEMGAQVKTPKKLKSGVEEEAQLREAVIAPTPTKRPKKKRKKGDVFDDLFDSLF